MITWLLFILCICLLLWLIQKTNARMKGLPPGPYCFPGIGCMIQIFMADRIPFIAFQKLSKYYGNIFYVQLGLVNAVVINGYDALHEILRSDEWLQRPDDKLVTDRCFGKSIGLLGSHGDFWVETRSFSVKTMREFGFGVKKSMEALIQLELAEFSTNILQKTQNTNGIILVDNLFHTATLNIIWSMVTGTRFNYHDPKLEKLFGLLLDWAKSGSIGAGLQTAYPFLSDWAPKFVGFDKQKKANRGIQQYLREIVAEIKSQVDYQTNGSNFIEVFLQKLEIRRDVNGENLDDIYSEENLISILYDFLLAGSETSSNTMAYGFLQMILNPDVQRTVRGEIKDVVGFHRFPALGDKEKMPYTDATILEVLRMSNVAPVFPRKLLVDSKIGKYRVPKGTVAYLNMYSAAMDEAVWGDPNIFRPQRFLSPEGKIINQDRFAPFGAGKRNCIGESVARATLFIMFTGLLQKFKFAINPAEGTPSEERIIGFTVSPKPFTMIVSPRQ